jgi:TldD protein
VTAFAPPKFLICPTRREFLATTSLAAGSLLCGARGVRAQQSGTHRVLSHMQAALPPRAWLPEPMTPEGLRTLSAHALDAAQNAGASYADVRVAERQQCSLGVLGGMIGNLTLTPEFMYGVRVIVDGAIAFVHGSVPTVDALSMAARNAVATARGYARLNGKKVELAPVPAITGEWETPMQLDPFSVPVMDQLALMLALGKAARARTSFGHAEFLWTRETRVFASTEGTMLTQTLHGAQSEVRVGANKLYYTPPIVLPVVLPSAGGYECITVPGLQDEIKQSAETAAELAALPRGTLDVGRYPVVLDGATLGATAVQTLGIALELDRVLGHELGAAGSSYLSPPRDVVGTMIASPMLSVTANRALPSITAARWDDEGVAAESLPLITAGRLVNYCASRDTASALDMGTPSRVTGCVTAPDADDQGYIRVPHLTIAPVTASARLEELCAGITRGVLVRNVDDTAVDQQLASGFMLFEESDTGAFEIIRGKITRRLEGNGLQFTTARLWKSLSALGDRSTVRPAALQLIKGQPETRCWQTASAPAGLFKEVDVITLKKRS